MESKDLYRYHRERQQVPDRQCIAVVTHGEIADRC